MVRKDLMDKIVKYAGVFVQEVKGYNAIGNYDINMHAENTLIPILNAIFDIGLVNANVEKKNHPAVDLIDKVNRVCFQITATADITKIESTLQKFFEHQLHASYDVVYIYVLTEKDDKYSASRISAVVQDTIDFNPDIHIIDFTGLLQKINHLSLERISTLARIYEHNFSNIQLDYRRKTFQEGFLRSVPEPVYLNLTKVSFPGRLFIATVNIDYKQVISTINGHRKRNKVPLLSYGDHVGAFYSTARHEGVENYDFILRENHVITFRNLHDEAEPLRRLVDTDTIDDLSPMEFYETSDDHLRSFKDLLRRCLIALCNGKEMEWVNNRKIIRFRNFPETPRSRSTMWIGKKESTKTVIFEMMSKAKKKGEPSHIICFRHMAFNPSFHLLDDEWYLAINPTWSFTNPGGYRPSRFESHYMTGLKRMENNNSVYYQFRFFAYFLSHEPPMFYEPYKHLKVIIIPPTQFAPSVDDAKWRPPKEFMAKNIRELELDFDNELKSNMF